MNTLIKVFPLIPVVFIFFTMFFNYIFKRDISLYMLKGCILSVILSGITLILLYINDPVSSYIPMSAMKFTIYYRIDIYKLFFLGALLVPSILIFFHHSVLNDLSSRMVFMFYITGCLGLVMTGDMFNFFVYYELMIISAYVLIAIRGDYYAAIKYMFFGALSSILFLAGIVIWFSLGEYFTLSSLFNLNKYDTRTIILILICFQSAFFIKSGFFPVSSWPATCHAATNSVVSTFLSSFTIFSGILGIIYFVIIPAIELDIEVVFIFLRIISFITVISTLIITLLEPNLKRCIAGSTLITIGICGLLLSIRDIRAACTVVFMHSIYKSVFFILYERMKIKKGNISIGLISVFVFGLMLMYSGIYLSNITKGMGPLLTEKAIFIILLYSLYSVFNKFNLRLLKERPHSLHLISLLLFICGVTFFYSKSIIGIDLILCMIIFVLSRVSAGSLLKKLKPLYNIEKRYLFCNLNYELSFTIVLFLAQALFYLYGMNII